MNAKLLTEHHLEFLFLSFSWYWFDQILIITPEFPSLKGGCTGLYEATLVKMPHCWKAHATAQFSLEISKFSLALQPEALVNTSGWVLFWSPGIQHSRFILSVSSQIPDSRKRPSPTSEAQMPNAPSSKEFDPLSKKSHQDPSKVMSSFGLSNDTGS